MKILYFSATGNSLYVAKSLGGELLSIPQLIKNNEYHICDDKIGIVFPLYGWAVPQYIVDYLNKVTFECDYLFSIITYGIFGGGVVNHLEDITMNASYSFDYINKIKMVDNYLPGFDMDKQIRDEHKKDIDQHLQIIKEEIDHNTRKIYTSSIILKYASRAMLKIKPNNTLKHNKRLVLHRHGEGIEQYYYVNDQCKQCKVCLKVCPVNNIKLSDKNICLRGKCIMCFACVQHCPFNAIHLRGERSNARYRNKHITLNEIIESNNQLSSK